MQPSAARTGHGCSPGSSGAPIGRPASSPVASALERLFAGGRAGAGARRRPGSDPVRPRRGRRRRRPAGQLRGGRRRPHPVRPAGGAPAGADRRAPSRSGCSGTGPTWSPSSGCSASSNVRTVMGTAQASGVVALLAARAGLPVRVPHAERGEGRGHRAGAGRQGAGHADGHPAARAGRPPRARPTPPTRSPWPSATAGGPRCWTGWPQAQARSAELARAHRARLAAAAREAAP